MKYTCTVTINAPLDRVVELWNDPTHFGQWQDGFHSIELVEGNVDEVGAVSRIKMKIGKRDMELIETLLVCDLPREKKGLYEHVHMTNTQSSRFEAQGEGLTKYTSEVEYTKFNGPMINVMARLFPGMFRKQSQKWMDQFKAFVEKQA
ncbi:MAG: SRPBCC family protein [Bacteroidia bacterium]|nr:SRPBCC family protein [Bacteroidia bacterium]